MQYRNLVILVTAALAAAPAFSADGESAAKASQLQQNWDSLSKAEQSAKKAEALGNASEKKTLWQGLGAEEKQVKIDAAKSSAKSKFGSRIAARRAAR